MRGAWIAGASMLLIGAGQAQAHERTVAIKAGRLIDTARVIVQQKKQS